MRWCYPAESIGDDLTYMVLLTEMNQLVPCSNVRPVNDPLYPNFHLHPDSRVPTVPRVPADADHTDLTDVTDFGPASGPPGEPKTPDDLPSRVYRTFMTSQLPCLSFHLKSSSV